ncbi:tyrosinase cofactor [Streptomyces sp. NPDC051684]|uniref:tyrosinase cofactor n=1 Tax=Streptomyces sp. NPDC051684 TaxID=3365670 RepID=UPI0037B22574
MTTILKRRPAVTRRSAGLILFGSVVSAAAVLHARPSTRDDPKPEGDESFDETYLGRRIVGTRLSGSTRARADAWHVTVDGRPLHLMRRADGTYLSMVDHYMSCPTPLAAAKEAVTELGDQQLRPHDREM